MTNRPRRDEPFAVWGMYPFEALRPAWSDLYAAVVAQAVTHGVEARAALRWDVDPHDSWLDPQLSIGMTCGWPLVTALRERVRVVGTFVYRHEPAPEPHLYRTVIVAREDSPLAGLAGAAAAINSSDSLSGCISLLDAFDLGTAWEGRVIETGGHLASIDAVRSGVADVASIDGMTWVYHQRDVPASLAGLCIVGRGPWVPGLPVVLPGTATDDDLAAWRSAIAATMSDPSVERTRETLLIEDFAPLDLADYDVALADLRRHRDR